MKILIVVQSCEIELQLLIQDLHKFNYHVPISHKSMRWLGKLHCSCKRVFDFVVSPPPCWMSWRTTWPKNINYLVHFVSWRISQIPRSMSRQSRLFNFSYDSLTNRTIILRLCERCDRWCQLSSSFWAGLLSCIKKIYQIITPLLNNTRRIIYNNVKKEVEQHFRPCNCQPIPKFILLAQ